MASKMTGFHLVNFFGEYMSIQWDLISAINFFSFAWQMSIMVLVEEPPLSRNDETFMYISLLDNLSI